MSGCNTKHALQRSHEVYIPLSSLITLKVTRHFSRERGRLLSFTESLGRGRELVAS